MYAATSILLQAIDMAKGDTTPAAFQRALHTGKFKTPWGQVSFNNGQTGIGNTYILKVVKEGNNYTRTDVYTYKDVLRNEPAKDKDAAPKM